eukprot:scaffold770_cov362-Pavlova_lutheri.AAC.16
MTRPLAAIIVFLSLVETMMSRANTTVKLFILDFTKLQNPQAYFAARAVMPSRTVCNSVLEWHQNTSPNCLSFAVNYNTRLCAKKS